MTPFWAEKNPARLIRAANLATLGKKVDVSPTDTWSPSAPWCRDQVLARHSTLGWASIVFVDDVRSDVVSQLVRHTKGLPRFSVQSWRPDWTGKPRPRTPDEKRILASKWSIIALQDMARERMCFKAMKETREYVAYDMRLALLNSNDLLMEATAMSMVPICVFQGGCPFGEKTCGYYHGRAVKFLPTKIDDIWARYELYNKDLEGKNV